jgi:pyruvate/2-oxoglutarate dehydrogenase complex dihydrolipoamide dehydrogenase (E3) component
MPPVPGIDKRNVVSFEVVLEAPHWNFEKNVVIGGGATGCEIALHLAQRQCRVTLVELLPDIATQLEAITRKVMLQLMKDNGVVLLTGHSLEKIDDSGVVLRSTQGAVEEIPADRVIVATGTRPDKRLYEEVASVGCKVHLIGDCLEARSAKAAIYEAAKLGRKL